MKRLLKKFVAILFLPLLVVEVVVYEVRRAWSNLDIIGTIKSDFRRNWNQIK